MPGNDPTFQDTRLATVPSPMAGSGSIPADATVLTLGEFRQFTEHLDGDVQIVVASEDWWLNVPEIVLPETEPGTHGHQAITFYPADTFDTRQF